MPKPRSTRPQCRIVFFLESVGSVVRCDGNSAFVSMVFHQERPDVKMEVHFCAAHYILYGFGQRLSIYDGGYFTVERIKHGR